MNNVQIWIIALCVAVVLWAVVGRITRGRRLRRYADQAGFRYCGNSLPDTLNLQGASFWDRWDRASNVISSVVDGEEVAIFDYHANHGDVGYNQTVLAARSEVPLADLGTFWRASGLSAERLGGWIIVFRPKEEVRVENLPAFISECRSFLRALRERQKPGIA